MLYKYLRHSVAHFVARLLNWLSTRHGTNNKLHLFGVRAHRLQFDRYLLCRNVLLMDVVEKNEAMFYFRYSFSVHFTHFRVTEEKSACARSVLVCVCARACTFTCFLRCHDCFCSLFYIQFIPSGVAHPICNCFSF